MSPRGGLDDLRHTVHMLRHLAPSFRPHGRQTVPVASMKVEAAQDEACYRTPIREGPDFATIGPLIGDPVRANMLLGLLRVPALTAGELADEGGVTAATIAGQLSFSVVLDKVGAFGLDEKPLSVGRVIGVALLAAGVFLIVRE